VPLPCAAVLSKMCARLQPRPGPSTGSLVRGRRLGQGRCADFFSTLVLYAPFKIPVTPCMWLNGHVLEKGGKVMTTDLARLTSGERKMLVG